LNPGSQGKKVLNHFKEYIQVMYSNIDPGINKLEMRNLKYSELGGISMI